MAGELRIATIGELIREQRMARRLIQTDLAERAGIDRIKMSRIENDEPPAPTPVELGRIADVLGTSVELYFAAAHFPLPYKGFYPEPHQFFEQHYHIKATEKNLPKICEKVTAAYREWLKKLGTYSQESVDRETAEALSNVLTPWPLSRAELALYEWFQLLKEYGICSKACEASRKAKDA